ncbi:MAG TPA: PP0621 family protein [Usitatibacter sp.]|nr:PP0621 family protein [Usitatibacter sp.]
MGRVLTLIILAVLVWWVFRSFMRAQVRDEAPRARSPEGEDMVKCARCGVNMPRSEAREDGGRLVCAANPHCH